MGGPPSEAISSGAPYVRNQERRRHHNTFLAVGLSMSATSTHAVKRQDGRMSKNLLPGISQKSVTMYRNGNCGQGGLARGSLGKDGAILLQA